jgi:hypothetical protein
MRRAYYDTTTGTITLVVPERIAPKITQPYITIDNNLNVNEYKINLDTISLERLPDDQILQVINRQVS